MNATHRHREVPAVTIELLAQTDDKVTVRFVTRVAGCPPLGEPQDWVASSLTVLYEPINLHETKGGGR